jgi:hypothetical protein
VSDTSETEDEAMPQPAAPRNLLRLPQETLHRIFDYVLADLAPRRSVWMRSEVQRCVEESQLIKLDFSSIWHRHELEMLLRIGLTCKSFYRAMAPNFMGLVILATKQECKSRLRSMRAFRSYYSVDSYPAESLRLRFDDCDGTILDRGLKMDASQLQEIIVGLLPSVKNVAIDIRGSFLRPSIFFEGAETEYQRDSRLKRQTLNQQEAIDMQSALNYFEDGKIEELHLSGPILQSSRNSIVGWRSDAPDAIARLRSLRTFVVNSFPIDSTLTRLSLKNVTDGWEVILKPFSALRRAYPHV